MIYFSDDFNFRKENFAALYSFFEKYSIIYDYDKKHTNKKKEQIISYKYDNIDVDTIYSEKYLNINIYNIYVYELIYMCSSTHKWKYLNIPANDRELCILLYNNFKDELFSLREKTLFFINYWNNVLKEKSINAGISFGGNLIYANSYAKVLASKNIPHFCLEHFFTGNDFYFERRYEPLPNNSILQNEVYCREQLKLVCDKTKKFIKLKNEKNKNVKQPQYTSSFGHDYILIIAQVSNDFSILSKNNIFKNTIKFYLDIIDNILNKTKYDIIVKTHPYELKKVADPSLTTFSILRNKLMTIGNLKDRVRIVEDFSINSLIDNAYIVVTINSQAGLVAAGRFKPVVCFGGAFYGHKGFTYDYTNINEFIKNIDNIQITLDHYTNYLHFMDATFNHLIGIGEEEKIKKIFDGSVSITKKAVDNIKNSNTDTQQRPKTSIFRMSSPIMVMSQLLLKNNIFSWRKTKKLLRSPIKFIKDSRLIKS